MNFLRIPMFAVPGIGALVLSFPFLAHAQPIEEFVRVSDKKDSFVFSSSKEKFTPWGFNYDHDAKSRLIEDYWHDEWKSVEDDFQEMKKLGANVVRVHLQFGKFMKSPTEPNKKELDQFSKLLALAEKTGLYLDVTGLGCYHKKDVPAWYDALDEKDRWKAQSAFWRAVAQRGAKSPAIFCYDLMNEPVVAGGKKKRKDWLAGAFAGKHFVQFINLHAGDRDRTAIAKQWIDTLVDAIRKEDSKHLITVGMVPWSLERPGLQSGFAPKKVAQKLDFICVHLYPESKKIDQAIETLKGFDVGKPIVIEETFPLKCSPDELQTFIKQSKKHAQGWVGFYWGKTLAEYKKGKTLPDAVMARWLEFFQEQAKSMKSD